MTQRKGQFRGTPHELSADERRKGALVANEKRRQQGLSLRARVAEKLDAKADAIVNAVLAKAETEGDGRDFLALWKQTHGMPAVEVTGEDGGAIQVELSDAAERFESRIARIAERGGEEGLAG